MMGIKEEIRAKMAEELRDTEPNKIEPSRVILKQLVDTVELLEGRIRTVEGQIEELRAKAEEQEVMGKQ